MKTFVAAAVVGAGCCGSAWAVVVASYSTQGVSGNTAAWNGAGSAETIALPAVRGAGLGLGGGLNQFTATGVATTPVLDLGLNDYVRFGFTLRQDAGAEYAVTSFRATCGSFGSGSVGMRYQVWGFFTDQEPFAITSGATVGSTTLIDVGALPGNAIVFPGQTAEIRVYFWGATGTQNGLAFISDGNALTPDVEIGAVPVPAPAGVVVMAGAAGFGLVGVRRRR